MPQGGYRQSARSAGNCGALQREGFGTHSANPKGKFKTCPLWIARYGPRPQIPARWRSYVVWQFSQSGSIDGITGDVDENTLGVSFTALKSKYTI